MYFCVFWCEFIDLVRGGGGGVLKEFLGGDVPLGPWNP